MGRQRMQAGQAYQVRARLRAYLAEQFGSVSRLRLLAQRGGWLKSNTVGGWVDEDHADMSVPDTASLAVLTRHTGINAAWLLSGVGPKRDPFAELACATQEVETPPGFEGEWDGAELREAIEKAISQRLSAQPEVETDEPTRTYDPAVLLRGNRASTCRFCSKEFRQQLQDPADVTSWGPPCCFDCFDEKVEIPQRRELYDNESRRLLIRMDLNDLFDR